MQPRFPGPIVVFALVALFTSSLMAGGQEPASSSEKKLYQPTGVEGTITGTISFTGQAPESKQIDTSADPACAGLNPDVRTEDVMVSDGKLANVVLYVKGGDVLDAYTFEQPESSVQLTHRGCRYEPHVLGLRTGQHLEILNSDSTAHNTHPTPKHNPEWNQTQAGGTPPVVKTLEKPETFIPFKDNQHPWEKAYVGVFTHPFFAVSDQSGAYKITGLPPGKYILVAWHERFGEKTAEILIAPGETQGLDFDFGTPQN